MNELQKNKIPISIASIQWFLTTIFQIDRLFFEYNYEISLMIATKILYYIFLVVAWCFGFNVYKKVKSGDENYKRGLYIFKIHVIIMMLFLLILWPGTWSIDDIAVLESISYYGSWNPWHHIITGAYQDVLLQILPFPGGIILLQNIIISVCVAFCITKLEVTFNIKRFKSKLIDIFIKILPFLLPPVLMYQFSGYRMGLYVYIELTMLVMLICASKDKGEWSKQYIGVFCFLCIIAASWRSESFFYMPFVCLLVLCVKKEIIPSVKKIICIVIIFIGLWGIVKIQNKMHDELFDSNRYELVSLINPCTDVVRSADYIEDAEELANIDKIFSIDLIYNNPGKNGLDMWYIMSEAKNDKYTQKDYIDFCNALIKLIMKYPKDVLAERFNLFIKSSGITQESFVNVDITATLFDRDSSDDPNVAILADGKIAGMPVFKHLRKNFINFLGMNNQDQPYIEIIKILIWNTIIPILILIYAWLEAAFKKKWYLIGVYTPVLIKLLIVIFMQPTEWFMYFLSFYLLGYVYFIYKLLIVISRKKVVINV